MIETVVIPAPLDTRYASGTLVVCHDAGGGNAILALIDSLGSQHDVTPVMLGPAKQLWLDRFPGVPAHGQLPHDLTAFQTVVTGTGWQTDVEHCARLIARQAGIRSIALLDHWVRYRERFMRGSEEVLPDELWVTDDYARVLATDLFPEVPVILKPNAYLAEQAAAAGAAPVDGDILFVGEPAHDTWGGQTAGEFQALDFLMEHRSHLHIGADIAMRIRPHPSDPDGRYASWIARHPGCTLDRTRSMAEALKPARWVAGLQSFGLVIALAAGREVISALPRPAPPCSLPHDGIIHLRDHV